MGKRLIRFNKGEQVHDWTLVRLCAVSGATVWECKCVCGNYSKIRESNLVFGNSKSCRRCGSIRGSKDAKEECQING